MDSGSVILVILSMITVLLSLVFYLSCEIKECVVNIKKKEQEKVSISDIKNNKKEDIE